jgi:hypothetical protein
MPEPISFQTLAYVLSLCLFVAGPAWRLGHNAGRREARGEHRPWCGCKSCVKWRAERETASPDSAPPKCGVCGAPFRSDGLRDVEWDHGIPGEEWCRKSKSPQRAHETQDQPTRATEKSANE